MIVVKSAKFSFSLKDFTVTYPDTHVPEIAIAGKSNVGKSSLINYISSNSKLAYVSKQPGKTRLVNYFLINNCFYIVDLPGYGYAKVSKKEKASWAEMMNGYFSASPNIKLLIILLDIRHDPSPDDIQMINWAQNWGTPFLVVLTKADKIAKSKRKNCIAHMKKIINASDDYPMIAVSSKEKVGKEELLSLMENFIS